MSFLDDCENAHGPMTAEGRKRLATFLANPTADNWNDASRLLIRPLMTVWQAVMALDKTFPKRGRVYDSNGRMVGEWVRIPDAITVARAIKKVNDRARLGLQADEFFMRGFLQPSGQVLPLFPRGP